MKLGQKIAGLRKKSSLSQEALAEKMNVSRQAVSKWESNQSIPDIEKIVDLSELFGVTTDYLLKNGTPSFELPGKSSEEKIEKALPAITDQEIDQYLEVAKKAAHFESLSIALFFLAIASFCLFSTLVFISHNIFGTVAYIAPIIIIAIALGYFIHAKLMMHEFKSITQNKFALTSTQNDLIDSSAHEFRNKNNRRIVIGVVLCILAIIPLILIWTLHLLPDWAWAVLAITFVLLGIASYQFTFYFLRQLAFKTISGRRKHLPKEEKSLLINGSVIFWIVLFLVYYLIRHYVPDPSIADHVSGLIFNLALVTYLIFTLIFFKKKAK
ncbi:helix-turn-helix domain-containing protein [Lactobacillus gallinarum]|uniref:Transcriptional regulator n=1 Tax=Lactobacillus gallinarum DSM 10532 = JCM 2011 TaxID=1423748 RepID=A0A0R1NSY4_9LACO|nr:helix-turn-helix transcriptional regulator [Lactobacillus gallinarum]KRL21412.1 transcriptional regulator [Lactobacillus gallinarum DSM 10532 = JCM 2011]